jgi:ATP-dependent DNA helicase RecQ
LLAELPELGSTDLASHLRELNALAAFEYVPPFRGRAIHVRQRDVAFDDVPIDFETLQRQKQAEYDRLETVLRFARECRCRQQQILEYFGQTDTEACGHCDNCRPETDGSRWGKPRAVAGPPLETVRIVLSGVARVSKRPFGCGKLLLAKMLCGASDKGVQRNRLDKLSTFGLLANLRQTEVLQLVDALLLCGLLEQVEIKKFRPIIQLTTRGADVMSGRAGGELNLPLPDELWRKLDADPQPAVVSTASGPVPDAALLARLRDWRDEAARSQNVPAYIVVNNGAMEELARVQPQSIEELLGIKGIGPAKVRQYGEELLRLLAAPGRADPARNDEQSAHDAPPQHDPALPAAPDEAPREAFPSAGPAPFAPSVESGRPSHYWTWRLLSAGFAPEECAAIRSLSVEAVLDHALRAADGGLEIDAAWFLAPELVAQIRQVTGGSAAGRIRPLLEKLPRGTRYEDVQLVVKSRRAAGRPR